MLLLLLFLVFSFLFISVLCFVLLLLSLFITFLLTCFFISYHVQYVKFCLSTSLLSSSTSPLFIYPRFLLTSVLPYFLSSLLLPHNYLFPVTITMPNFFPPPFSSLLYLSLLLPFSFTFLPIKIPLSPSFPSCNSRSIFRQVSNTTVAPHVCASF